jgi:hypothetical protein
MVASDLQLMLFDLNDGSKDSYMIKDYEFTKETQKQSFDELMKKINYYE